MAKTQTKETISLRLTPAARTELDWVVELLGVSRTDFIEDAVAFYMEFQRGLIEKIEGRIEEAENGTFADDATVNETFDRLLK